MTSACYDLDSCSDIVRSIQRDHRDIRNWGDIGFNFLVGGDGAVYVGRNWNTIGAHTKGYNQNSIGICFIGNFETDEPKPQQLDAALQLITNGVRLKKLTPNYKIYGQLQLQATLSPGKHLFNVISSWKHWDDIGAIN